MALSVTYTTIDGQIVYENRGGTQSFYAPDTLGSTALLLSTSGTVTDTFTYWPYGEIVSHVGSNTSPFTFVGTLGYYLDILDNFIYVRARYLRQALARWQTADALWPLASVFGYAQNSPVQDVDPSGRLSAKQCLGLCFLPCLAAPELCWECYSFCDSASTLQQFNQVLNSTMRRRGTCAHPKTLTDCFQCPGQGGIFVGHCYTCVDRLGKTNLGQCLCDYIGTQKPARGCPRGPVQNDPCDVVHKRIKVGEI